MKKRSGVPVVNPTESLSEMQRHLRREPEKFGLPWRAQILLSGLEPESLSLPFLGKADVYDL